MNELAINHIIHCDAEEIFIRDMLDTYETSVEKLQFILRMLLRPRTPIIEWRLKRLKRTYDVKVAWGERANDCQDIGICAAVQ